MSDWGKLWTVGLIFSGAGVGTYALSRITRALIEGDLITELRRSQRRRTVERMEDHYIIVGAGRLGQSVLEEMLAAGCKICVVERDEQEVELLQRRGIPVIQGDGSHDDVLRAAGVERARGMAVAVHSGAEATFVTLSARHLAPDLAIATRAADQEEAMKARRAGASSVVSPFNMGGWRMAHGLIRPDTSHFLDLATLSMHDELLLDELLIPESSPVIGETLRRLNIRGRYGLLVVALRKRSGELIPIPKADQVFGAGDVVIIIGKPTGVRAFEQDITP